ncbi:MAG: type II toxin-antitoxin system PemK/MazF family toxin [Candidatus Aminicenantes bacterium]
MDKEIKRGDVVIVDLDPIRGSETGKTRPCVIIQSDIGNKYSPVTIVAVITNQKEISKEYPTDVWVSTSPGSSPVYSPLFALIQHQAAVNKQVFHTFAVLMHIIPIFGSDLPNILLS